VEPDLDRQGQRVTAIVHIDTAVSPFISSTAHMEMTKQV
jgi:hypothetical protein